MLKKLNCKLLCTALVLSGILMSGCDSSTAELVDEITTETIASVTVETTKSTVETVSETTTATTSETATEVTTTETAAEVTTTTATEADIEVPTPTETTTESQTETIMETTTETTTETTQPLNLTPEELEVYNSMPDIVFVLSHHYMVSTIDSKYTNIRGFYITKDGETKMYAFSNEEERKYRYVTEVYDELENVTCSALTFRSEEDEIKQDDLDTMPISYLIELYRKLLIVDENSEFEERDNFENASYGVYELYGIRKNKNGDKEIILLSLSGDYYLISEDIYAQEISNEIWNIGYPFTEYKN